MTNKLTIENIFSSLPEMMCSDQIRLKGDLKKSMSLNSLKDNSIPPQRREMIKDSIARAEYRQQSLPLITYSDALPVIKQKEEIKSLLAQYQVVIVAGETGSGKTTQLPKICLEIGRGIKGYIGHTQPRRVAARTVALRIAEELKSPLGKYVGYKIRFNQNITENSYIKLMTDGILLAELHHDPLLSQYDTLIIDEAHERSLNIDFILGYIKQILPKRPDLKVIITSATLDPERFSEYFDQAPILYIEGRTYPVDIVYKPLLNEDDQQQSLIQSISELAHKKAGDILVFLSGEREIHEVSHALQKLHLPFTEVLPLYSRLNTAQQNKVFQSHRGIRIILATNVAETSLTVPGIKYVIDTGYARIKRYSHRSKIQRLPIEPISQASAKQRAGRCGRIGPGVCIRLYAEEDYLSRKTFTEPEILRSNLASVILQMGHLELGHVAEFPFINKPDPRLIRDGYRVLAELNAIDANQNLTKLGKRLAKLPIDPRLGTMLLAAESEGCIKEMLIIVSGLSIQDPRERPLEWQQAADEKHLQYQDVQSDFMSLLNLWHSFKAQETQLSQRKLRQYCRDHFLSYLRLREWQDLHHQLTEVIQELKIRVNVIEANYMAIHKSLLAGLLSHIGYKQEDKTYLGARNTRFYIFPGSGLFKQKPRWIIALELIEIKKLYARMVAHIEPRWIEEIGDRLIKRSYYEPHWDKHRKQVVALEKKVLYGLIISANRKINYGPIDSKIAREIFIQDGIIQGGFISQSPFYQHNLKVIEELNKLEQRLRTKDICIDEKLLSEFYELRIPNEIYDGLTFEKWEKNASPKALEPLFFSIDFFLPPEKMQAILADYPDYLMIETIKIPLEYHFEPDECIDGVTAIIPLIVLNQLKQDYFDWLVPGLLKEKITALIKGLPKSLRRYFSPVNHYVETFIHQLSEEDKQQSLLKVLILYLEKMVNIKIPQEVWSTILLPTYLSMYLHIVDNEKNIIESGNDLTLLQEQLKTEAHAQLHELHISDWEKDKLIQWDFSDLPESVNILCEGVRVIAYPTLIEQEHHVQLRLLSDQKQAEYLTYKGLRKLFFLALAKECQYLKKSIPHLTPMALYFLPLGSCEGLIVDLINAGLQKTFLTHLIRTQQDFHEQLKQHKSQFIENVYLIADIAYTCLANFHEIRKQCQHLPQEVKNDIQNQLKRVMHLHFIADTPYSWFTRLPVYLKAILIRINKRGNLVRELAAIKELTYYQNQYENHLKQFPTCQNHLMTFQWQLEEYRISLFAQELKTIQSISSKRLDKFWQEHLSQFHNISE